MTYISSSLLVVTHYIRNWSLFRGGGLVQIEGGSQTFMQEKDGPQMSAHILSSQVVGRVVGR